MGREKKINMKRSILLIVPGTAIIFKKVVFCCTIFLLFSKIISYSYWINRRGDYLNSIQGHGQIISSLPVHAQT